MRAIVLHEVGPAENLRLENRAMPSVSPRHVVVQVRAAGVCHRDIVDRRGGFPFMKRPVVPGHEFAGEVVALGEGVVDLAVGDRVVNLHRAACGHCDYCSAGHEPRCLNELFSFGLTTDGGYAEFVLAPAGSLVPLPADIPFEKGCFLACTAGVALRALRTRAQVRAGERVLITGASGGVGLHAIQIARNLGATPIAVTSSEAKVDSLLARGADQVIVSRDVAFHKEVRRRGGVDVVLDCVGTPTLNSSLRSLKPMGRLVLVGNVTAQRAEVNPGLLILTECSIVGSSGCSRRDLEEVLGWVRAGKLRPCLAEVLPLEAAPLAQLRLEKKEVMGRLVLAP